MNPTLRRVGSSPLTLWIGFVLVHFWLGLLNLYAPGFPLGDVTLVYKFWMDQALEAHYWVGIDSSWVYPVLALIPMVISRVLGPTLFGSTWLSLVMVLDAIAFAMLTGWGLRRQNVAVAWWWLGFLVLLGPIALGRLDSITVPIAIVGVLFIATRPRLAVVILTVATWIKVWPAALIAAIVIAVKGRARLIVAAVGTSALVIGGALALGSGLNVFSFITQQTGRGLQIEAPISTIWLWRGFAGVGDTNVYYDTGILTYQVRGDGVDVAAAVMTPVLVVALAAIVALGILAVRRRAGVAEVLPSLALALVTAFIAFNKVGSPQYITWLAVPLILGLATNAAGYGRPFRTPAIFTLVLAGLTQLIYPYFYDGLLFLNPVMLIVMSAKNILLFVLLGWAIVQLWQAWRLEPLDDADDEHWLPEVWPFAPVERRDRVDEHVSVSEKE